MILLRIPNFPRDFQRFIFKTLFFPKHDNSNLREDVRTETICLMCSQLLRHRVLSAQTSPAETSVLDRGLVVSDPHWKDIVKEEKRYCTHIKKTSQGHVLGYVTPVGLTASRQHFPPHASDVILTPVLLHYSNALREFVLEVSPLSVSSLTKRHFEPQTEVGAKMHRVHVSNMAPQV